MNIITSSEQSGGVKITVTVEVCDTSSPRSFLEQIAYPGWTDNHSDELDDLLIALRQIVPSQLEQLKARIDSAVLKPLSDRRLAEAEGSKDRKSFNNSINNKKEGV